jgi:hypothetical protein
VLQEATCLSEDLGVDEQQGSEDHRDPTTRPLKLSRPRNLRSNESIMHSNLFFCTQPSGYVPNP